MTSIAQLSEVGIAVTYEAGEQVVKRAIKKTINIATDSKLDWTGTGEQPSNIEKTGLLGLKILTTVGATAAVILLPQVSIPLLCCHQIAAAGAAAVVVKGAISGTASGINDYFTKQINGNTTPEPEKRKEYTDTLKNARIGITISGAILAGPYSDGIKAAATLAETGAVFAYDAMPEKANETIKAGATLLEAVSVIVYDAVSEKANETIDKIKQFLK